MGMQDRWSRRAFSLVALAALAGVIGAGSVARAEEQVKEYQFGVIAKSQSNPVFQAARTGAFDAAADLSKKYGIKVTINWRTPTNEDAQKQAEFVENLASQGVDGIAVSCTDANLLTSAIDDAVTKGVPVVTFDSDAPKSKRFAYYGIDDVEAGRKVMSELAKAMGDKGGTIAILGGNQNAPNLQARIKGVKEEAAKYKNIKVKDTFYHKETANDAAAMVQQVQTSNPEIAGWAMVGGWPLFTQNALDGVYDKAKVTSVDALPEQIEYVKKNQVQALVVQDCYGWGYESVMMLFNKVHDNKTPAKVVNNFELKVCTPANAAEYDGLWKKWLGKKEEAKPEEKKAK
jgi:ribose transport system substrate-binding protein